MKNSRNTINDVNRCVIIISSNHVIQYLNGSAFELLVVVVAVAAAAAAAAAVVVVVEAAVVGPQRVKKCITIFKWFANILYFLH